MFGAFVLERDVLQWRQLPAALRDWLQGAGTMAFLGLALWGLAQLLQGNLNRHRLLSTRRAQGVFGLALASGLAFLVLGAIFPLSWMLPRTFQKFLPSGGLSPTMTAGDWLYTLAGALALAAVITPLALDLVTRFRWVRIWAMARLAIKEAMRRRVVIVFGAMALIFLFADWFVPYARPEDQVRNYVRVVYWSMTPLFLMTASLLGAFSIPADLKNASMHTIVTKPVEKFEIVLGRFLGYGLLLSVALAAVASLSLVYVLRGVHPTAEKESLRARRPEFGMMSFQGTANPNQGENVGRVWSYRTYIGGKPVNQPDASLQYAVWSFDDLSADMADPSKNVRLEFTFDIFRLTKGDQENRGVFCSFTLADGRLDLLNIEGLLKKIRQERDVLQAKARRELASGAEIKQRLDAIEMELIAKYGVHEIRAVEIKDYTTQFQEAPSALFKKILDQDQQTPREINAQGARPPLLRVLVNVDQNSAAQRLGVARRDFYLLASERPFWLNFYKGVVGMWCNVLLVLGLALALSTYLSGVISWLTTLFLVGAGMFTPFVRELAEGRLEGGGPLTNLYRIFTRVQHSAPLDESASTNILQGADAVYAWFLRRVLNFFPDVTRHDLHQYVANGFDISWGQVLFLDNLLPLVAYLSPWLLLSYYTMKYREIANPS